MVMMIRVDRYATGMVLHDEITRVVERKIKFLHFLFCEHASRLKWGNKKEWLVVQPKRPWSNWTPNFFWRRVRASRHVTRLVPNRSNYLPLLLRWGSKLTKLIRQQDREHRHTNGEQVSRNRSTSFLEKSWTRLRSTGVMTDFVNFHACYWRSNLICYASATRLWFTSICSFTPCLHFFAN